MIIILIKKNIIISKNIICKYHPEKNIEYYCFNFNEYLCSACLIFMNSENVAKHKDHIILWIENINEFNLGKIIEEYKTLSDIKNGSDNNASFNKMKVQELRENQKIINDIFYNIKLKLKTKFSKKINKWKKLWIY